LRRFTAIKPLADAVARGRSRTSQSMIGGKGRAGPSNGRFAPEPVFPDFGSCQRVRPNNHEQRRAGGSPARDIAYGLKT
jgi:hypothetical protein